MFVNKGDYLLFDGIDLDIELPDDDNAKGKVDRFINEVEMFLFGELRKYGVTREDVNNNNLPDVKYAICYQIRHFLKYGRDNVFDFNAWNTLHNCGLVNVIRG